jgi:hypothetical protein
LQADIAGARLAVVAGAEHWMAWYLAEEVAGQLRSFL